jgi:hypothetical protein
VQEDAHELIIGYLDPTVVVSVDLTESLCELLDCNTGAEGQLMRSNQSIGSSRTGQSDQK